MLWHSYSSSPFHTPSPPSAFVLFCCIFVLQPIGVTQGHPCGMVRSFFLWMSAAIYKLYVTRAWGLFSMKNIFRFFGCLELGHHLPSLKTAYVCVWLALAGWELLGGACSLQPSQGKDLKIGRLCQYASHRSCDTKVGGLLKFQSPSLDSYSAFMQDLLAQLESIFHLGTCPVRVPLHPLNPSQQFLDSEIIPFDRSFQQGLLEQWMFH